QDAHVGDEPLDAVLRQQADAVARGDAGVGEGGGTGQGLLAVVLPAQVVVDAQAAEADSGARPEPLGLAAEQFGKVQVVHGARSLARGLRRSRLRPATATSTSGDGAPSYGGPGVGKVASPTVQ